MLVTLRGQHVNNNPSLQLLKAIQHVQFALFQASAWQTEPKSPQCDACLTLSLPKYILFGNFLYCLPYNSNHANFENSVSFKLHVIILDRYFALFSSLVCLILYWNREEKFSLGQHLGKCMEISMENINKVSRLNSTQFSKLKLLKMCHN